MVHVTCYICIASHFTIASSLISLQCSTKEGHKSSIDVLKPEGDAHGEKSDLVWRYCQMQTYASLLSSSSSLCVILSQMGNDKDP